MYLPLLYHYESLGAFTAGNDSPSWPTGTWFDSRQTIAAEIRDVFRTATVGTLRGWPTHKLKGFF